MKIALVIDVFSDKGNGTSMSAQRFVSQLVARGHSVVILCNSAVSSKTESEEIVGFDPLIIPVFQPLIEEQHAVLAKPNDKKIREALKDVDIVHIYLPFWLGNHAARIAKELHKPVLTCFHMSAENITYSIEMGKSHFANSFTYQVLKLTHYKMKWTQDIYCPSRCIAARAVKEGYDQNMHIISNGYNPAFKPKKVARPAKYKDKFVIVSVGRHTKEKAQHLIIKAVAKSAYKDKIVVILAGKGPMSRNYKTLAEKLGVNCEFVFLNQAELIKLHNYADLFIQASYVETESIACLEAIACGLVPLISDGEMCATKQFALDDRSTFTSGDYEDMSKKIDYWCSHPEELSGMRAKYAEFALKFSIEKSIDAIEECYANIIQRFNSNSKTQTIADAEGGNTLQISASTQVIRDYNNKKIYTIPKIIDTTNIYKERDVLSDKK